MLFLWDTEILLWDIEKLFLCTPVVGLSSLTLLLNKKLMKLLYEPILYPDTMSPSSRKPSHLLSNSLAQASTQTQEAGFKKSPSPLEFPLPSPCPILSRHVCFYGILKEGDPGNRGCGRREDFLEVPHQTSKCVLHKEKLLIEPTIARLRVKGL